MFFFSSRRRHTRLQGDWSSTCALPICREVGPRTRGRSHGGHREGDAGVSDVLYFNGRFTTTDERVLGVEDRGFQFGDALYEVFKFLRKQPVFLSEHYRRMEHGLREIGIASPWDEERFATIVHELLARTA